MPQITSSYHHGDLHAALVGAGLALARKGGVDAVGVRDVTRQAGVSPAAAYRHFEDHRALVLAVALAAQDHLAEAIVARIATETADAPGDRDAAVARLRGVGLGYIDFALAEPGWFELALLTFDPGGEAPSVMVAEQIPAPFLLLLQALDACLDAGILTAAQREHAEWPCWSAVHGFADIATRGPLRGQDPAVLAALGADVVERIIAGVRADR
ncbi:TetR/AcrR family transcriptional regulator [Demequina activiva]|uniref:TetR family transcriptional regulator n=1 Tax=Demequina activiva TaxID=1582364 RepID=A0A919Q2R8_9MICO|nr:TetR/AcrR family transcriptional regulator [Demequina activiva]GIG55185.1 TetR family transcriptional regulator [Demequina activiva]